MRAFQCDNMSVKVYENQEALGTAAAHNLAAILCDVVAENGDAAVIFATGNSMFNFFKALRLRKDIDWKKISIFHMDEYLGMSDQHPASFRYFLNDQLIRFIEPVKFFGIHGETLDIDVEMTRYESLLEMHAPVACVLGIGENGHLAFNDPPADFDTVKNIHVVALDNASRQQQVGEGHFATLDDVPQRAISLTVPALLMPTYVLGVVPEARKAIAVKAALEGPITPMCPASILRSNSNVNLYLDEDAAALLKLAF